jgi:phage shock protein E
MRVVSTLLGTCLAASVSAAEIEPEKALSEIERGAVVIDVRTPEEFREGHWEGAKNIPHTEIEQRAGEVGAEKDRSIVVYCKSGRRSEMAQGVLTQLGYKNVVNGGGLSDLIAASKK